MFTLPVLIGIAPGASEELVVVRIHGGGFGKRWCCDELGRDCEKSQKWLEANSGMIGAEDHADALVLFENLGRKYQLNSAIAPRLEDPSGDTAEEDGRDEDVRVEDDPHREARAFATARFTSAGFMPAFRAAPRAVRTSSSNSA